MLSGIELIDVGIQHIEGVGVPEGTHELALGLGNCFLGEAVGQPGHGGGIEIPAYGVCALLVKQYPGVHNVADLKIRWALRYSFTASFPAITLEMAAGIL